MKKPREEMPIVESYEVQKLIQKIKALGSSGDEQAIETLNTIADSFIYNK